MIHADHTTNPGSISATETTRVIRRSETAALLAEDLADQADLERERFNAGWNAAAELCARLAAHEGHKAFAALIRRQRKAE